MTTTFTVTIVCDRCGKHETMDFWDNKDDGRANLIWTLTKKGWWDEGENSDFQKCPDCAKKQDGPQ